MLCPMYALTNNERLMYTTGPGVTVQADTAMDEGGADRGPFESVISPSSNSPTALADHAAYSKGRYWQGTSTPASGCT